jgi:hypothetical protein
MWNGYEPFYGKPNQDKQTLKKWVGAEIYNWTVLDKPITRTKSFARMLTCQCKCGTVKEVLIATLQNGSSRSCGC